MAERPDLEEIRKRHQRAGRGYRGTENYGCIGCSDVYPCGAEQAIDYVLALERQHEALRDEIRDTRAWAVETGREHDALRARLEDSERQLAASERAAEQLQAERDDRGSALTMIETEVSEFFDDDCPEIEPVEMVRYVLRRLATAVKERDEARLESQEFQDSAGGWALQYDVAESALEQARDRATTLARELEAARAALHQYGRHHVTCPVAVARSRHHSLTCGLCANPACTCGLAAALAPGKDES